MYSIVLLIQDNGHLEEAVDIMNCTNLSMFLTDFNEIAHTCQRSTSKIDRS